MYLITSTTNNEKMLTKTMKLAVNYCRNSIKEVTGLIENRIDFDYNEFGDIKIVTFTFMLNKGIEFMYIELANDYHYID